MHRLVRFIFKQHDVGIWWGALKNTISESSFVITVFNMVMLVPTFYVTVVSPWCLANNIEFPFWLVVVIIISSGLAVLLIQYKIFTPSSFAFWATQFWEHGDNPITKKQEEQNLRLKAIEDKLDILIGTKDEDKI
jgi:hypothetical protein